MRTIGTVGMICFYLGLFLKLFHIHYNALFMLAGLLAMLVSALAFILNRNTRYEGYLKGVQFLWLTSLFLLVKFLPYSTPFLVMAALASFGFLLKGFKKVPQKTGLLPLLSAGIAVLCFLTPTHKRFEFFNIRWNHELSTDYITLDKYAWFLYQNEKYGESIENLTTALEMARQQKDHAWEKRINVHLLAAESHNWTHFQKHQEDE